MVMNCTLHYLTHELAAQECTGVFTSVDGVNLRSQI